jgi:hypothetical protein
MSYFSCSNRASNFKKKFKKIYITQFLNSVNSGNKEILSCQFDYYKFEHYRKINYFNGFIILGSIFIFIISFILVIIFFLLIIY